MQIHDNIIWMFQKKPDWSKGKPGDAQKVKEEEVEAWALPAGPNPYTFP